jgi:hypothetical protein
VISFLGGRFNAYADRGERIPQTFRQFLSWFAETIQNVSQEGLLTASKNLIEFYDYLNANFLLFEEALKGDQNKTNNRNEGVQACQLQHPP